MASWELPRAMPPSPVRRTVGPLGHYRCEQMGFGRRSGTTIDERFRKNFTGQSENGRRPHHPTKRCRQGPPARTVPGNGAGKIQVFGLRPDYFSFRKNWRAGSKTLSPDRSCRRVPQPQDFYRRTESLAEGRRGLAARVKSQSAACANLLHDPGQDCSSGLFVVYKPEEAVAFQFFTLLGESSACEMGFHGDADPVYPA